MKKAFAASLLLVCILFYLLPSYSAVAAAAQPIGDISDNLFDTDHETTGDGSKAHYQIDVTSKEEEEEGGFTGMFKTVGSWVSGDAIKDSVLAQFYEGMNFFVNIMFKVNMYMTNTMLTVLDYSYHFDVINKIIEKIEGVMQGITGISGGMFGQTGLFGQFLILISVLVGIVFVYQYFFKGAQIEATGTFVKTVGILIVALVFFSNYGAVLKGMNNLTTELTGRIMNASSGLASGGTNDAVQTSMSDNMWNLFVHRPYLYLQYGSDNESAVGESRVDALLKLAPGDDRQAYVEEQEVTDQGNMMMTYAKVPDRLVFTILYSSVNFITSLPIFALALLIILFQFWFLAIAVAAPFYIVLAAFPKMSGIFRRYVEELALPLLLKLAVSIIALIVFTMSAIVYEVSNSDSVGYFATALIELVVLALLFILRKRFMRILFEGGTLVRSVSREISNFDHHVTGKVKDMKRKIAKGAAQAAGAAVAGPQGAAIGGAAADAMMPEDTKNEPLENVSLNDGENAEGGSERTGAASGISGESEALETVPLNQPAAGEERQHDGRGEPVQTVPLAGLAAGEAAATRQDGKLVPLHKGKHHAASAGGSGSAPGAAAGAHELPVSEPSRETSLPVETIHSPAQGVPQPSDAAAVSSVTSAGTGTLIPMESGTPHSTQPEPSTLQPRTAQPSSPVTMPGSARVADVVPLPPVVSLGERGKVQLSSSKNAPREKIRTAQGSVIMDSLHDTGAYTGGADRGSEDAHVRTGGDPLDIVSLKEDREGDE